MKQTFGSVVRGRRVAKGFSTRELGGRIGVSHTCVAQIENDRHVPRPATLAALAKALDVSVTLLTRLAAEQRLVRLTATYNARVARLRRRVS